MKCPTCGQEEKLSDPQRDRYFALLQAYCRHPKILASGVTVRGLHEYLADLILPSREVNTPMGPKRVRGSVSKRAGVGKMTMSEYMDRVEAWASEVGIWEVE